MRRAEKHLGTGTRFPSKHLMMIFRFNAASTERPATPRTCAPPAYMLENLALHLFLWQSQDILLQGKGGVISNATAVGKHFIHLAHRSWLSPLSVITFWFSCSSVWQAHECTDLRSPHAYQFTGTCKPSLSVMLNFVIPAGFSDDGAQPFIVRRENKGRNESNWVWQVNTHSCG